VTVSKRLVLDANILLRVVLGTRVRNLLEVYEDSAAFYAPDVCFDDARKYPSVIAQERKFDPLPGLAVLAEMARIVESVELSLYAEFEAKARLRIATRDPDDWPIVATSLLLDCPVWTEDQDFFGSGIATWPTAKVITMPSLFQSNDKSGPDTTRAPSHLSRKWASSRSSLRFSIAAIASGCSFSSKASSFRGSKDSTV